VKNPLLITFTKSETLDIDLGVVTKSYEITSIKIFVLKLSESDELIISYNVENSGNLKYLPNTISAHRKSETNTIYTINALNNLIKTLNNGKLDNTFTIDWNLYKNNLILTDNSGYKLYETSIYKIINFY
jgi:hypothetical protein